ncbi:hypothetical protein HZS_616 [Henneguya salminicola]|nr:hypothetical protein HZS_616 [Henneguya salminicola]
MRIRINMIFRILLDFFIYIKHVIINSYPLTRDLEISHCYQVTGFNKFVNLGIYFDFNYYLILPEIIELRLEKNSSEKKYDNF